MSNLKIPQLIVNGIVYKPKSPKARVWRKIMEFNENELNIPAIDYIDKMAEVIALAFGNEEITKDIILDNVDLSKMRAFFSDIFVWFVAQLNGKMEEIPKNVETEKVK